MANEEKSITGRFIADIRCSAEIDGDDIVNGINDTQRSALIKMASRICCGELLYRSIVIVKLPENPSDSLVCLCMYSSGGGITIGIERDGYTHS